MGNVSERKLNHLKICLNKPVEAKGVDAGFDDVFLIHRALPEIDIDEVSLETFFLKHRLSAPIIVNGMTGGHEEALKINSALAEAVEKLGIGMGVGSQRAAIEDPSLAYTYSIVREKAPKAFIIANLGAPQLSKGYGVKEALKAVDMVKADALAIHLNPMHEAMQFKGEPMYRNVASKIKEIAKSISIPIIAKECGAGIAMEEARILQEAGVEAIDVGGAGGTSWAAVEYYRASSLGYEAHKALAEAFWDWGIPTVISLCEAKYATSLKMIASGGVRSGIDVAKAIALGANVAGMAAPLLKPAFEGGCEAVVGRLRMVMEELKVAMFLTGARRVDDLEKARVVVKGETGRWLRARGVRLRDGIWF